MSKKDQHFVPRLYLRLFATDRDSYRQHISLHLIPRNHTIHGASIKHQCQRKWFYGKDERIEDWLGYLENRVASTLHGIRNNRKLPEGP